MNKRLWIVFAALIVVVLGGLILWKKADAPKSDIDLDVVDGTKLITAKEVGESSIPDHYIGKTDSKVVVIEYEDFACSHCQAFHTYAEKIHRDYKDKVLFIYRDFSLSYPNSIATISAAEAAYLLGGEEAFWKMYKLLFQDTKWVGQAVPTDERKTILDSYAREIGLDVDKFDEALLNTSQNGVQAKIDRDKELGGKADVTGTPTWFVNGKRVDQATDDQIRTAIDSALKAAD
jgi:protein-disulfide isomerase